MNTVDPKGKTYGEELWCKGCATCWDVSDYGKNCSECGKRGKPSSFEKRRSIADERAA